MKGIKRTAPCGQTGDGRTERNKLKERSIVHGFILTEVVSRVNALNRKG